jgi:methylated-DNA-[protein]-cysteine S-methyltransferase
VLGHSKTAMSENGYSGMRHPLSLRRGTDEKGADMDETCETSCIYASPLGDITLAAREDALVGLWFVGQKYDLGTLFSHGEGDSPALASARAWLDRYFAGEKPSLDDLPPLAPDGTAFQRLVWDELLTIPYGQTTTYGAIARRIAESTGRSTSARAVGAAVGRNRISIIVPCHRVLGADGSLTGYAGGVERKAALLKLEGVAL